MKVKIMKTLSGSDLSVQTIKVMSDTLVELSHTVRTSRDAPRVQIDSWKLDFENVSLAEILELASRTVKIIKQRDWTKAPDRNNAKKWDNITISVRAVVDNMGKRAVVDSVTAAERALDKLSPDQLEAQLVKMIAAKAERAKKENEELIEAKK